MSRISTLLLSVALCACGSDSDDSGSRTPIEPLFHGPRLEESAWVHHGTGVHEGASVTVAELLARPRSFAEGPVRVRGEIVAVCQSRGCWLRLGSAEQSVIVRFEGDRFRLDKNATGEAVVEGVARLEEISVAVRRRLLEDEGRPEEAAKITEPAYEITSLVARGVAVRRSDR
jgi:hypothetical protein